jgi:hypothetical protein
MARRSWDTLGRVDGPAPKVHAAGTSPDHERSHPFSRLPPGFTEPPRSRSDLGKRRFDARIGHVLGMIKHFGEPGGLFVPEAKFEGDRSAPDSG